MSGAPPLRPTLADMGTLLRAARSMEDAWGATLELCLLTLGLPWKIVSIDLERIDWSSRTVPVPARGGTDRVLALGHAAQLAVLRIAGAAGGSGQVVTAGRGPRLQAPTFRLDRLLDRLAVAAPDTIAMRPWNFHGVREEAARLIHEAGAARAEIDATLGRKPVGTVRAAAGRRAGRRTVRGDAELALLGAERWSRLLFDAPSIQPNARSTD